MTSRELRKQRRETERKARKLEYKQNRIAAASAEQICGAGSPAGEPLARAAVFVAPVAAAKPGPTGPRSAEGKAISSGNSLKHGLASGRIIISGEDPAAFEALLDGLTAEHAPTTETESLLVKQMAQSWWLMQRALRMQTEAFNGMDVDTHKLALFLRYQTTHERAFYKALNTLMKLKQNRVSVGAVACPARSEFVSQPRSQAYSEIGFVSQKTAISAASSPSRDVQPAAARPLQPQAA